MRIRLTLLPVDKKAVLPINYNYYLTSLIYRFIFSSSRDYSSFLHNEGYRMGESKKGFKLFTYSMLNGRKYTVKSDVIIFENAPIIWEISSPVDIFLQHLITGAFTQGQLIDIGYGGARKNKGLGLGAETGIRTAAVGVKEEADIGVTGARFLIDRVETAPKPDFKKTMCFTCLSPITVSRVYDKKTGAGKIAVRETSVNNFGAELNENIDNDSGNFINDADLGCHYIRPWEDGFSEAIEQNLIKKYRLVYGKDPEGGSGNLGNLDKGSDKPDFKITIDNGYMNKKGGRITKKLNFKGTEIIGFMAPFEVTGNPELIEIGYEAGFGEKGSIGCGMVREC
ncbi:MAG: CRISPR-associated endoribonuclease Cas6 [bacterium]